MSFANFSPLGGLSRRIYTAFLLAAVIPTALAGAIGVYLSLQTLKDETLRNLNQEVAIRSQGIGRFFDQLSSELLYLANARGLVDLVTAHRSGDPELRRIATVRLERDYAALATLYPHVYQIRFITSDGEERVRVDRKPEGVHVVPASQLQPKGDRYYFREAINVPVGKIYVSPLDLNVEFGKVEKPERPVVRIATPVVNGSGEKVGVIIINLHADIVLEQIQQMANARHGVAYLLDSQDHYLSRSAGSESGTFSMEPVTRLREIFPATVMQSLLEGGSAPSVADGWIVAQSPIDYATNILAETSRGKWRIALAFPERELFNAVFNLYLLYAVLFVALIVTAIGGYALSRRLLRPLEALSRESEAIARGDLGARVAVAGDDEIAALGTKFNAMAEQLQESTRQLTSHRDRLEEEVRLRTRELEQERTALQAVIENTADGILAIDDDAVIRLSNPAAASLLGVSVPLGRAIGEFWEQWPEIIEASSGGYCRRDIQLGEVVLALAVTRTTAGHIVVARDVSHEREIQDERRELDRQMFQMEKLTTLGELAMGLAHEIGNPLAGMKAVAQAMQYEEDVPTGLLEALRRLESEIDRLSGFLRTFHGFAAPQILAAEPCSLADILDDVLFWTRKDAKTHDIVIDCCGVDGLPALRADSHQLKQVFLNLLMNAVHAMPAGGSIRISAEAEGEHARISVADTGVGMPADVAAKVFAPFFTTRRDGTGLGLAIVSKIVSQHSGSIRVESVAGQGTCFTLDWPLMKVGQ